MKQLLIPAFTLILVLAANGGRYNSQARFVFRPLIKTSFLPEYQVASATRKPCTYKSCGIIVPPLFSPLTRKIGYNEEVNRNKFRANILKGGGSFHSSRPTVKPPCQCQNDTAGHHSSPVAPNNNSPLPEDSPSTTNLPTIPSSTPPTQPASDCSTTASTTTNAADVYTTTTENSSCGNSLIAGTTTTQLPSTTTSTGTPPTKPTSGCSSTPTTIATTDAYTTTTEKNCFNAPDMTTIHSQSSQSPHETPSTQLASSCNNTESTTMTTTTDNYESTTQSTEKKPNHGSPLETTSTTKSHSSAAPVPTSTPHTNGGSGMTTGSLVGMGQTTSPKSHRTTGSTLNGIHTTPLTPTTRVVLHPSLSSSTILPPIGRPPPRPNFQLSFSHSVSVS